MGLKFSALDKLISLMKSADYYLDSKTDQEIEERKTEDNKLQQQITTNKTEQDNKFKDYYDKAEVDQLVVYYGDGTDSLTVPINADQLEGHPASYFIEADSDLQDSIAAEQTVRTEAIQGLQNTITTAIAEEAASRQTADAALQNTISDEVSARQAADNTLQNTITNEVSARQEVDNALTARMNTFTSLPEGSTAGDAELADIRVGANGITYPNAGGAVRGQISELKSDLVELSMSDFFPHADTYVNDYKIIETGSVHSGVGFFGPMYVERIKPNITAGTYTIKKGRFKSSFGLNTEIEIVKEYGSQSAGVGIEINDIIYPNEFLDITVQNGGINQSQEKTIHSNYVFKISSGKVSELHANYRFSGSLVLRSFNPSKIQINTVNGVLFGDSLCELNNVVSHQFSRLIPNRTGWNIVNLAHSGTGFSKGYNGASKYRDYISQIPSNTRLIMVSASLNDLDSGLPMGNWNDQTEDTIGGCIQKFFEEISGKFPTSTIICFTTTPWVNRSGVNSTVQEYVALIEKICGYYNIPFKCLYTDSIIRTALGTGNQALMNSYYLKPTTTSGDGIHPNNIGHELIFRKLWAFINENVNANGFIVNYF